MTGGSSDRAVHRFADLANGIAARPSRLGSVRLIAVDGPAGSGKTSFAARLAAALAADGMTVAVLHTDDLLDGWTEPSAFWPRLEDWVLGPLRRGEPGAYRPYDWFAGRFDAAWRPVPVPEALIIEGVSSGRAAIRPELTLLVWVYAPPAVRLARGIARDGAALRPQWLRWMTDEAEHFARDHTADHAGVRVDAGSEISPIPPREFVGDISGWTDVTC